MINVINLIVESIVEGYNFIVGALTFINQCLDLLITIWANPSIPFQWCIPLSVSVLILKFILRKGQ